MIGLKKQADSDRLKVLKQHTDINGIVWLTVHTTLLKESKVGRSAMCDGSQFHCMIVRG